MPAIMCHALALNAAADACCLYRTATCRRCLLLVLHCSLPPMPAACTALLLAADASGCCLYCTATCCRCLLLVQHCYLPQLEKPPRGERRATVPLCLPSPGRHWPASRARADSEIAPPAPRQDWARRVRNETWWQDRRLSRAVAADAKGHGSAAGQELAECGRWL